MRKTTSQEQAKIKGLCNISNVVSELWARTSSKLEPSELEWFTDAGEAAANQLNNIEDVMAGIGCLILADNAEGNAGRTGAFQNGSDCATLLFFLAESVQQARALLTVADSANYRLRTMAK